jgi:tetratricopeptide (TPR) repeat protein
MLETIREFALERLRESGAEDDLRRRHAERMLEFAGEGKLGEEYGEADVGVVLAEREDLRGALDWAEENDPSFGLQLAVELQHLWNASAPQEGLERIQRLLGRAGDVPLELRASALRVAGGSADLAGHDEFAEELTRESVELYRQLGDDRGVSIVEEMLAVSAWRRQDWDRVRELSQHSLALAEGRFPFIETSNYWLLGQLALNDGDVERAIELTRRGTEMAHAADWIWWESGQRHELLMLELRHGDLEGAEREGLVALEMQREQENRLWALYTLAGLAQVALARGDLERAGLLWGAAETEGESLPRWADERARRIGALAEEDREQVVAARERGGALDLWAAAEIALGDAD